MAHTNMASGRRRRRSNLIGELEEPYGFYDYHDIRVPIVFTSRQLGAAKILTKNGQAKPGSCV